MAKKKAKKVKTYTKSTEIKKFQISERVQDYIFIGLITVLLLVLLKPLVLDRLSPQGVDVIGSKGKSHQLSEYAKETGERALWNPYIFSGMPLYHRIGPVAFSVDNILNKLGSLLHPIFVYYLLAALGFYVLMRYLKMSPLISFAATLFFILMPHYKSLYLEGHIAKLKAVTFVPWIFLAFKYFLDKRTLFGAALFALSFGMQIRTQHYQIVFYTGLLIFAVCVYPILKDLLAREYKTFLKSIVLVVAAVTLAILMAAQPLFLAKEYLPYSKRGKTTIDVNKPQPTEEDREKADGVSMQYATQWSTHPSETFTWFVPRFYGGMSAEKYTGSEVPRAKGQMIPGYWGYMPFTQSYEYMGALTLLLAALGLYFYRRDRLILSLAIFAVFLVLLSFGRHFESFYGMFYHYVPFFNKFRAPMMSVTVNFFIISIFAAYGLKYLSELNREEFDLKKYKSIFYILGGFFVLGVVLWLAGRGFNFVKPSGEAYQGQTLELIKKIRVEYFNHDAIRYIILILLSSGMIIGYLKKKINATVLILVLIGISLFDLINIQTRMHKKFIDVTKLEKRYFKASSTDNYLLGDNSLYRIFPAGKLFGDNRWAYYHQTIGGYTPIKMYTIEELVEKNIYNGPDQALPFNWNVLKTLNVKYLVLQGKVQNEHLLLVHENAASNLYTYFFNDFLPRGFFVDEFKVIEDEYARIRAINSSAFDPAKTAIVEEKINETFSNPDSSWSKVTQFTPNKIAFNVFTDKQALFVISELYYPPGWKIFVDEKQVENIYRTNHAIQSIVIPAGEHKAELRFEPESFSRNIKLSYASLGMIYLVIAFSVFKMVREKADS